MARNTGRSWKTGATTGNRQGITPARMVGSSLCSDKTRTQGRDARAVLLGANRGSHGWLPLFLLLIAGIANAAPLANFAGKRPSAASVAKPPFTRPIEQPATPEQLAAARGMEMILVDSMIQEMRKSVPESDIVPLTQGERIFRGMLDSEYARVISESGTLGISDLVLAELKGKR